jgi:hypothetical protein
MLKLKDEYKNEILRMLLAGSYICLIIPATAAYKYCLGDDTVNIKKDICIYLFSSGIIIYVTWFILKFKKSRKKK